MRIRPFHWLDVESGLEPEHGDTGSIPFAFIAAAASDVRRKVASALAASGLLEPVISAAANTVVL